MTQRNTNQAIVAVVAAGLADKYHINVWLIRFLFTLSFFVFGFGFFVYIWLWSTVPSNTGQIDLKFS